MTTEKKTVYIANVSKQRHLFCYHAKNDHSVGKLIELVIDEGTQIKIEDSAEVLAGVIKRYQRYGMIEVKEIGRAKKFSGLMFQYDNPVNITKLKEAVERRHEIEDENSNEMRILGVLGDQANADKVAKEVGMPELKVTSQVEEKQSPALASQRSRALKQTLTVTEDGERRRANA